MSDSIKFISHSVWSLLQQVQVPGFGVSFALFFVFLFMLKLLLRFIGITNGSEKTTYTNTNNNNTIYKLEK